jgi:anaphase-promoting complex subunit 3
VSVADTVQHYLGLCIYPTAIFLAERLYAEQPTDRNLLLLATCYVRAGDTKAACSILQSSTSPENRYEKMPCMTKKSVPDSFAPSGRVTRSRPMLL